MYPREKAYDYRETIQHCKLLYTPTHAAIDHVLLVPIAPRTLTPRSITYNMDAYDG